MPVSTPARPQFQRLLQTGQTPTVGNPGSFALNLPDRKLWSFDATGAAVLVAQYVTEHNPALVYVAGDLVVTGQTLWRAPGSVPAGSFNPAQWVRMTADDTLPPATVTNSGLLTGGVISSPGGNQIAAAAGSGVVVDMTVPGTPGLTSVSWGSQTITLASGGPSRIVAISAAGTLVALAVSDIGTALRTHVVLGFAYVDAAGTILGLANVPAVARTAAGDVADTLASAVSPFVVDGARLSPGAGLGLQLSAGTLFGRNARWRSAPGNPNFAAVSAGAITFDIVYANGNVISAAATQLQTAVYEAGFVSPGSATLQYLFADPLYGRKWVQVGQAVYPSVSTAVNSVERDWDSFVPAVSKSASVLLGAAAVSQNATAFGTQAVVIPIRAGIQNPAQFSNFGLSAEFMRLDGSTPMQGPLDLGGNPMQNVVIDEGIF